MDREIYHTLYVSFTIIIMCSLCITSITNSNARLSAGEGTRQVFALVCNVCRCRVNMSVLCICVYFVKRARRILYEDSLARGQTGGCDITLHGEKGRNALSLGTINTEASKLGV